MDRTTEIIAVNSIEQIPSLGAIRAIPRERTLKLVFDKSIQAQREAIGQKLKQELDGFQIGIHTIEPEINIEKLISDNEIEQNQGFLNNAQRIIGNWGKN